jgi:NifU-like protein involved in Fe-S cluster formation
MPRGIDSGAGGPDLSRMIDDLYSAKVLRLAAETPRLGRLSHPHGTSEKVSKLCGSRVVVDVKVDGDRIVDLAQDVKACALGQAAASVLGAHALGATLAEVEGTRDALRAMLKSGGPPPEGRFADLALLAPVKDYPARHTSTMLAFEAAAEAVRTAVEHPARCPTSSS